MRFSIAVLSLAAATPVVYGIAFEGPAPTAVSPERVQIESKPQPTQAPSVDELKRRQTNRNPNTCGWIDEDLDSGVTCSMGRTCMLYTSASVRMAGCCAGGDTQACGWSDACVDYNAYAAGQCGSNCMFNDFVRKCTALTAPFCVTWTYPGDGVADFGCAATSTNTVYTVLQRATNGFSGTTSMSLPTISGNAVSFELISTGDETRTAGTSNPTNLSTSSGSSTTKKVAIGLIVGIVIAALAVIFFIVMGVCCFVKRKKKQRLIAANASAVAAAQANRPQSQFPPPQQQAPPMQQMPLQQGGYIPPPGPQQSGFLPPVSPQSPQQHNGYFAPPATQDQKYDPHMSVTEYAPTPISSPSSPAPVYAQPYGNPNQPSMPGQPTVHAHYYNAADGSQAVSPPAQYQNPPVGAHEVDAISVPHAPQGSGPVYEMGHGK
ncbi:hypothetical protein ACN47E_003931 [Coniothyrium glycines]